MIRTLTLAGVLAAALAGASAPLRAQDKVDHTDRKTGKTVTTAGTIESDTPAGLRVKAGAAVTDIPFADVQHIVYSLSEVKPFEYNPPFVSLRTATAPGLEPADRAKKLKEAREKLEALAPRVGTSPGATRLVQYRIAEVAAHQARDDASQRAEAVRLLTKFKADHPSCWQLVPAVKQLAKLHEEAGDVEAARAAYEGLAESPRVPKDTKEEARLLLGQMLLRAKKYPEAEAAFAALGEALSEGDARRPRVLVSLTMSQVEQKKLDAAEKQLDAAVRGAEDAALLAMAHNARGDYHRAKGQAAEAFWHYLRVDVMYHQDREEHAKALYHLAKLYEGVRKDPLRAQLAADRLKDKAFEGTEYHGRITGEGK